MFLKVLPYYFGNEIELALLMNAGKHQKRGGKYGTAHGAAIDSFGRMYWFWDHNEHSLAHRSRLGHEEFTGVAQPIQPFWRINYPELNSQQGRNGVPHAELQHPRSSCRIPMMYFAGAGDNHVDRAHAETASILNRTVGDFGQTICSTGFVSSELPS